MCIRDSSKADEYRKQLNDKGFAEAFVIAVFKGEVISIGGPGAFKINFYLGEDRKILEDLYQHESITLIFCILLLGSCSVSEKARPDTIQQVLFDTTFNYSDVKAIDLVETKQGEIISTKTLDEKQRGAFIEKLYA